MTWEPVAGRTAGDRLDGLGATSAVVALGPEVYVAGEAGLYRSDDFGETWKRLGEVTGVRALALSRYMHADPTVFVGTVEGLLKSADAGHNLRPTALVGVEVHRLEWPGPTLVAATSAGLAFSDDGGASFRTPRAGLPDGGVSAFVLSSFFAADPVLFAAPAAGGVFRSADGGASWSASGLANERIGDLVWLGPFLYAAAESGLFRSQDAGKSWSRIGEPCGRPVRLLFPLAPAAGLEAFLATDQGLCRTADGGHTWAPAGLPGAVLEVATFPAPQPERRRRR